jgi:lipoprotein-releasing system ATP-binding protein
MNPHDDTPVLQAENLHKSFEYPIRVKILKGVNLTVKRGETVAITGRSGQGKSTLLQLLGTLEPPTTGSIKVVNQHLTLFNKGKIRNKNIAFIFQSFHLLEDYTALENVMMPARIGREDISIGSAAYQRGLLLLNQVGLADRAHFSTKLLSGGEKQRVAIARALCNDPDLILADEPSGNLDKQTADQIHGLLLDFARKGNKSVIIVTHDRNLAALCDSQYELTDGKLEKLQ